MKNKFIIMIIMIFIASVLVGCATGPNVSEEQSEKIANYSTALLLKYDANYKTRLVDTAAIEAERAQIAAEEQARLEAMEQAAAEQAAAEAIEETENSNQNVIEEDVILDIGDILGVGPIDVVYSYYEVVDQYPEEEENSFAPVMQTAEGNKLLVVHFTMTNSTTEDQYISVLDKDVLFRLDTNVMERKNTFATLLLNDLGNFEGTFTPGEMLDLVLITEMNENESIGIENIYLTIVINGESYRTKLQ